MNDKKPTIYSDCRLCSNCTGYSCKIYGDDPEVACNACGQDGCANYHPVYTEKN